VKKEQSYSAHGFFSSPHKAQKETRGKKRRRGRKERGKK
jgi:hypothetical protein